MTPSSYLIAITSGVGAVCLFVGVLIGFTWGSEARRDEIQHAYRLGYGRGFAEAARRLAGKPPRLDVREVHHG